MELGEYNSYFGLPGSDLINTWDIESREHRRSNLDDVARSARLTDALPNMDFVMSSAYPNELDPHRSYIEEFRAMVNNTTKPLVMTCENADDLRVMWEVSCKIRGGAEELRFKPYFIMYSEPICPLMHSETALEKLLPCADWAAAASLTGTRGGRNGASDARWAHSTGYGRITLRPRDPSTPPSRRTVSLWHGALGARP